LAATHKSSLLIQAKQIDIE